MENKYLLSYLKDFYNDPRMDRVIDYFKVDLDYYLYAYGSQFSSRNNTEKDLCALYGENKSVRNNKHEFLYSPVNYIKKRLYDFALDYQTRHIKKKSIEEGHYKKVLFIEPLSISTKTQFANHGIRAVCLDEYNNESYPEIKSLFTWYDSLNKLPFNERLRLDRYACLDKFISSIQRIFFDFEGLFVGNEEYFVCKLFIDAFKGMNIPTYCWSHGIDANSGIPRRVDYRLVWGEGIKQNLIDDGEAPDTIIVSGNINYANIPPATSFRNDLDDVLVLTSVTVANIRHSWDYNSFPTWDRGLLITYIYSVERVLKSLGVKSARLRPHPINNYKWVERFIDTNFYRIDNQTLDQSLKKATLTIGPTSSTFVEALRAGVTYLVYEPGSNGLNIIGRKIEPPFDGSDEDLKVAFNEEQLKELIESKYSCNQKILDKYIVPFNFESFVHTLGKK